MNFKCISDNCPQKEGCINFLKKSYNGLNEVDMILEFDSEEEDCQYFIDSDEYFDDDYFLAD